jgi:hypothetical protein
VVPIELLWIPLWVVFGIVGYTRGISRELGATLPILIGMYLLLKFGNLLARLVDSGLRLVGLGGYVGSPDERLFTWVLYSIFMLFFVLISYMGVTLDFPGVSSKRPYTNLVDALSGLMNGYLAIGTVWYYLNSFGYPIQRVGLYQSPLSPLAQTLVRFLPLNVLPQATAEWYLLGFILFLVILRVIR